MHDLKNLVVDPIIKSHKGKRLLSTEGVNKLRSLLIPLSFLITPNIPEAEILTEGKIKSLSHIKDAAKFMYGLGAKNVLIKGGHAAGQFKYREDDLDSGVVDVLYDGKSFEYFEEERIITEKVHGTGCMYSAAIAAELAKGNGLISSITNAKKFITEIIKTPLMFGKGHGLGDLS